MAAAAAQQCGARCWQRPCPTRSIVHGGPVAWRPSRQPCLQQRPQQQARQSRSGSSLSLRCQAGGFGAPAGGDQAPALPNSREECVSGLAAAALPPPPLPARHAVPGLACRPLLAACTAAGTVCADRSSPPLAAPPRLRCADRAGGGRHRGAAGRGGGPQQGLLWRRRSQADRRRACAGERGRGAGAACAGHPGGHAPPAGQAVHDRQLRRGAGGGGGRRRAGGRPAAVRG